MIENLTALRTAAQEAADLFKAADSEAERSEARALLAEAVEALQDAQAEERRALNAVSLLLPGETTTRGGAKLDPAAIRAAIAGLGLKAPVEVTLIAGLRKGGSHRMKDGTHRITLTTYANAALTTNVLHHELEHAVQAEREGYETFRRNYRYRNGGNGFTRFYENNP